MGRDGEEVEDGAEEEGIHKRTTVYGLLASILKLLGNETPIG